MANAPQFIIMGAMKCATTTLHEQLNAQPGVFMSEPKEPNFFSDDDQYKKGMDWYLELFSEAGAADICGESSTHYTKLPTYPEALPRLQRHLPEVKLIYVMRHPIERLISQYVHEWSQRVVSGDFSQALTSRLELYQYSSYAMQLKPYLEAFGPERVLPVFLERLKQNPHSEFERISQFIGCPQAAQWQEDSGHRHASRERLRDNPLRDAIVNAPILSTLRKRLVPQSVRDRIKGLWQMQQRPQLSESERARLEERLDQDLAELGHWLGLSLSCQTYSEVVSSHSPEWDMGHVPQLASSRTASSLPTSSLPTSSLRI